MIKCLEIRSKNKEEALKKALLELNVNQEVEEIEEIEQPIKGFLGFLGSKEGLYKFTVIEKESDMSGNTHTKGMHIIGGYIGNKYAMDFPISLSCRVCFEQSYSGIDGDSASSTEIYCILSSLSGIPVNQNIAVTGSVNQFGDIQAIGGVNEKTEAFFDICNRRGLTGKQGVMIPESNRKDLMLKEEIAEAVKEGKFHIYTVTNIDDGIEIMLSAPAGKIESDGQYTEGSVHRKVYEKLKYYHIKSFEDPTEEAEDKEDKKEE